MEVSIITVGDEILIGQITDTNSAWIGRQLNLMGARVASIHSVGDEIRDIISALELAVEQADVVLMTGGLGPTKDDITKKALAVFTDCEMAFHEPTYKRIERIFERFGRDVTDAHRQQCYMPEKAELLPNRKGTAPGMFFEHRGKAIASVPGIPYEMKNIMSKEVFPRLKKKFPGKPIGHRTVLTVGAGESDIARRLEEFESGLPDNVKLAYLPNLGQVRLRISGRDDDPERLERVLEEKSRELTEQLPDLVFGYEEQKLEEVLGNSLREKGLTLATAESCTGGYLAHCITAVAGASDYFQGSVIAYSNRVKREQLGVSQKTLEAQGAVSEATVREMVSGALDSGGRCVDHQSNKDTGG